MDALFDFEKQLNHWLQGPQGEAVARSFMTQLCPHIDYLRGDVLLQLGGHLQNPWLKPLSYQQKWVASHSDSGVSLSLRADLLHLPFDRHSVDCVLMPLTLESLPQDESYLFDEIDRIISSSGYVIILGVNPWGFWGLANRLNLLKRSGFAPISCRSPLSVQRAFSLRHFYLCSLNGFYFLPPLKMEQSLQRFELLNEVGMMLWAFPASFYCLIMQKLSPIEMTPLLNINHDMMSVQLNSFSMDASFSQKRKLQSP